MPNVFGKKLTQEEWDNLEKEFLAGFYKYFEELNSSIQILRKNDENPLIRSQACIAFIAVDTFSRLHKIFQGETDSKSLSEENEKRFKSWLDEFVFTVRNETYQKHKSKIRCDAGVAWKLRNSFIHFYSFPEIKEKQSNIAFSFKIREDEYRKMERVIKESTGKKIVFIDIYYLIDAIFRGLLLQWKGLAEMIENSPDAYIDRVVFAHSIIMKEGASTIRLKSK